MKGTSIVAIYLLFWVMSAFLVMPFHVRTTEEEGGELVAGQSESAPHNFRPGKILLWTTLVATILFGAYYVNYVNEWLTPADFDFTR